MLQIGKTNSGTFHHQIHVKKWFQYTFLTGRGEGAGGWVGLTSAWENIKK